MKTRNRLEGQGVVGRSPYEGELNSGASSAVLNPGRYNSEFYHSLLLRTPLETIILIHQCESTMSHLSDVLSLMNRPRNILVQAEIQIAGIGRGENVWSSPEGGLWFSFSFSYPISHPLVSLYTGWCLHQSMLELFPLLKMGLRIKWPNDIMYQDGKLAGILCRHSTDRYIIGIGANTNDPEITTTDGLSAISLMDILGFPVSNASVLHEFMTCFYDHLYLLAQPQIMTDRINQNLYSQLETMVIDQGERLLTASVLNVEPDGGLSIKPVDAIKQTIYFGSMRKPV